MVGAVSTSMQLSAHIAGIEIAEDAVRVVVVRTGGRAPRIVEALQAPLAAGAGPEASAMAVRELLGRLGARPSAVVLSAPASWSVLRLLKVPFRSSRKIAAAVPFELEPTLAIPIDGLVVEHLVARTSGGETEVLAMGVRRESIDKHISALSAAGVRIDGVYLDALALTSLWAGPRKRDAAAQAVLHFRAHEAVLGVVENGRLTYLRRLDLDPSTFRANPAAAALEVRNLLRAYAAERGEGVPPVALSVTGAPTYEAGRTVFESEFDMPVRYDDLASELVGFSDNVSGGEALQDDLNRWSAPIAAAYAAAGGPFSVNFLKEVRQGGLARLALRTCLAGAGVLVAYFVLVFVDYRKDRARLDTLGDAIFQELQATFPELAQDRPADDIGGATSLRLLEDAALAESDESEGVSLERFSAPPLLDVLMEISAALDSKVAEITRMSQRPSSKEITIEGVVIDAASYDAAIEKLNQSQLIDVDRDHSTRTSEGAKDNFVLRVRVV